MTKPVAVAWVEWAAWISNPTLAIEKAWGRNIYRRLYEGLHLARGVAFSNACSPLRSRQLKDLQRLFPIAILD